MKKKLFRFFSISQWEKEEEFLREQHKQGWALDHVELCMYYFNQCEPEDMVYQLDFNPEGVEQKEEYVQMFKDCGWEYLQDFVDYSYFRKPAVQMGERDEAIYSDDRSRLDMLNRVFKKRVMLLLALFLAVMLPQTVQNIMRGEMRITAVFAVLDAIYVWVLVTFGMEYWKVRRRAEREI